MSYAEGVMTSTSLPCCLPPRRDTMELVNAKISRCVFYIAAYVGLPGSAVSVK